MDRLGRLHDATSRLLFAAACLALAAAAGLYLFEVAARYLFAAPTTWSGELVRYGLAVLIFAALPEVTRRNAHVAIDILPASLPSRLVGPLGRLNATIAGLACAAAGWIAANEAARQAARGLMTNSAFPIPRWWITAVIALGLASAAVHFLREALRR